MKENDIAANITTNLKTFMQERKLSLNEFAAEIGIPRSTLQGIMNEGTAVRTDTLQLIANGMGLPPEKLVSKPEESNPFQRTLNSELARQSNLLHPLLIPFVRNLMKDLLAFSQKLYQWERNWNGAEK